MKSVYLIILTLVLAGVVSYATTKIVQPKIAVNSSTTTAKEVKASESVYDRVMRTGILRCGYVVFPPQFNKDPITGEFSGIAHDITEEMAKRLNLKVEWAGETNFATMNADLSANRYDGICFSLYRWVPSARAIDYSTKLFCSPTHIYTRLKEDRFRDISSINNKNIRIANIDGEGSDTIAREEFPKADIISYPQSTDLSQLFLSLTSNKVDVVFANPLMATKYMEANPNKIKNITSDDPIRLYCHSLAFKKGAHDIINTLNLSLEEMHNFGTIDKILEKYDPNNKLFYRILKPYEVEKQ